MSRFNFPTNPETENYCLEIVRTLTIFFSITEEDAIARVNAQWRHTTLADERGQDVLFHYEPAYWAKWIFFGDKFWRDQNAATASSLSRLEHKMNRMMDHLGLDYRGVADHVLTLVRLGRKLDAITLYRQETGLDLKECKDVIERLLLQEQR